MSLILGNPFQGSPHSEEEKEEGSIPFIKTTLVIVPISLVDQWWRELHTRIATAADGSPDSFQMLDLTDPRRVQSSFIDMEHLRRPADEEHPNPSEWGKEHDGCTCISASVSLLVEARRSWISKDRVHSTFPSQTPWKMNII
jgi:hypothetical protein